MKRLIALFLLGLCSSITGVAATSDITLDEIVVIVNDGIVLRSEVEAEKTFLTAQARSAGQQLPGGEVLDERVRELLINREIQRQRAASLGIDIDEASISDAIEQVARNNNLNSFDFRSALQSQGIDYTQFRNNIRHELLLNRLINREVERNINISNQEIDDFIKSAAQPDAANRVYLISHILIAAAADGPSGSLNEARNQATELVNQIRSGADFKTIAASRSDGPRALNGGDLGWRRLSELPAFLHDAVRSSEAGATSDPIQSPDGFHIIRVEQTRQAELPANIETRARHIFIATSATDNAANQKAQQLLGELRQQLTNGASFAALASEYSEDPNSADNGGELPWFTRGELPAPLEQRASLLKIGELSNAFQTRYGWHLLEVLERREVAESDEQRRRDAELSLRARKIEQETDRWSRRLRSEAFVEVLRP